jgi:NTE family protein
MAAGKEHPVPTRALVLGGGGPVGIAWETGLAAGLAEGGVAVGEADLIVGTSAGSVVGAQLALGRSPQEMVEAQRTAGVAQQRPTASPAQGPPDLTGLMQLMIKMAASDGPRETMLAEVGAFALRAQTAAEEDFIATFARMIGVADWPARRFACTAIDTADGAFVVWDNDADVELARAVASSCAVPGVYPPITIDGRRYMDGGVRSATNADLARGHDIVLVVAVAAGTAPAGADPQRAAMAEASRRRLEGELDGLRQGGSSVALVTPDAGSLDAFGPNLMDPARRPATLDAGLRQGRAEAARLRESWSAARVGMASAASPDA